MQVVHDVATNLAHIHGAGLVHRNVKPSHIVQHPRTRIWTLIDFSAAATLGDRLEFVCDDPQAVQYAAPETVDAILHMEGHDETATNSAAIDAWSLGVVTYELLTGEPWTAQISADSSTV
jgi:serine/threonine protein kinase